MLVTRNSLFVSTVDRVDEFRLTDGEFIKTFFISDPSVYHRECQFYPHHWDLDIDNNEGDIVAAYGAGPVYAWKISSVPAWKNSGGKQSYSETIEIPFRNRLLQSIAYVHPYVYMLISSSINRYNRHTKTYDQSIQVNDSARKMYYAKSLGKRGGFILEGSHSIEFLVDGVTLKSDIPNILTTVYNQETQTSFIFLLSM